jgi:hypothetical protein
MSKKSVLILAALSLSLAALASDRSPLQPAVDQPICLKRVYTDAHLARHPGQNLKEIHVLLNRKIEHYTDETGGTSTSDWTMAKVSGRVPGDVNTLYINEFGCEFRPDGSAKCFIECDGGSFLLKPRNSAREALLQVSPGYYWPLYKEGLDQDSAASEEPGNRLSFQSDDKENETYRLEVVPAAECEWDKTAKPVSMGC